MHNLKIACVLDAQHPVVIGARQMAEIAEKESGGRLKITVYPSSQLGGQREVLQNLQAGIVDGVIDATATLTNFVPQLAVVDLPYLAKDQAAAFRLFDSPVFEREFWPACCCCRLSHRAGLGGHVPQRLYPQPSDQQRGGSERPEDPRHTEPLLHCAVPRVSGAAPVTMAFGEVYTALQQGVIDGAENDSVTYQTSKHMEVARNLALTSHMMLANTLYISERVWERLPDDLKAAINKASGEARKTVVAKHSSRDAKVLDEIRAGEINVTQPDLAPFTAIGQQTYKELAERLGPDLVDHIVAAAK